MNQIMADAGVRVSRALLSPAALKPCTIAPTF
jgi:hypothetical protein